MLMKAWEGELKPKAQKEREVLRKVAVPGA